MFSVDIYTKIAMFAGERTLLDIMYKAGLIVPEVYSHIQDFGKILIHGQVQSGKTAAIIEVIGRPVYTNYTKILIIQNSLLVLNQYVTRFTSANIDFQVVDKKTREINADVVILMNNIHRRNQYKSIESKPEKIIVIMDECDVYYNHDIGTAACEYYVTATPYINKYKNYFDRVIELTPADDYFGFDKINIEYLHPFHKSINVVNRFLRSGNEGMLLMNDLNKVQCMQTRCQNLSVIYDKIPFICLNSEKWLYLNGEKTKIKKRSISHIIDHFKAYPRIVFVANRLSLRGLSYTSSDYTRHLTHQYSNYRFANRHCLTNYIQKMRIFGKYQNHPNLTLMVSESCQEIVNKMIETSAQTVAEKDAISWCKMLD
jgi:hypothetical protein